MDRDFLRRESAHEDMDNGAHSETASSRLRMATAGDIFKDALRNYQQNNNTNQAAAVAFYAILSLIPLFILTVIALGHVFGANPDLQENLIETLQNIHPYFSSSILSQLGQIENKKTVLGWAGIISLVWLSGMIFSALEKALNMIFRVESFRNYFLAKILALSMIPLGWGIGIASVAISYGAKILAEQSLLVGEAGAVVYFAHSFFFAYIFPYLLTASFAAVLYKVVPNCKVSSFGALLGGAIFALLVEVVKHLFTGYVSHYTRYNVIFGSLETVVLLVIWVFYVALIFLFCAEVVASYQRRDLLLLKTAFLGNGGASQTINERLLRKFGRKFEAGTFIFRQSDAGREMYYVLQGRVRVEKQSHGNRKVLAEMGPGSYFGEMAVLVEFQRTASALAVEDSILVVIDAGIFRDLLRESSEVSLFMLREFCERIKYTSEALETLNQAWLDLVIVLYLLKEWPFREPGSDVQVLAAYAGQDPQEIGLALERLALNNVIAMKDGNILDFRKEAALQVAERR